MAFATVPTIAQVTAAGDRWVAIYARISKDRSGKADNVTTQIKLATAYAQERWPGVRIEVYRDNDLSAADPDTFRPEYHRLLGDIQAGRVGQIVSADHERLIRQIIEGEALIPLLRAAGIEGTYGYRDGFTSVRPGETTMTRFKHVMGADYVESLRVKLHEKLAALAAKGVPHGGKHYGYRQGVTPAGDKTLVVDDDQAGWLRWMAEQVLVEDRPVTHVATELNERNVPTKLVWTPGTLKAERERHEAGLEPEPRVPARWSSGSVKGVLTNLTVAGRRQYRGEDVGRGNWEPIFDMETHQMLRAKLLRARNSPRAAIRKYELSGIMVCDECDARMVGQRKASEGRPDGCQYRCKLCFKVSIDGTSVEDWVAARLLERLEELVELRRADDTSAERRAEITAGLDGLGERRALIGDMVATGEMDRIAAVRGKARLDTLQYELTRELAGLRSIDELPDPKAVRHAWAHLDPTERRGILGLFIEQIRVARPKSNARRVDLSRISIHGAGWEGTDTPPPPGAVAAAWRPEAKDLTDDEWDLVKDLVAPDGRGNRAFASLKYPLRRIVNAALYRETTGCFWRQLPKRYPPAKTVDRYYQHWINTGAWPALCARLQAHATGEPALFDEPAKPQRWRAAPSDVTDQEWDAVAELVVPPSSGRQGSRGRPLTIDRRQVLNAVLHREATGCAWAELPDRYPDQRIAARFYNHWRNAGTWDQIRTHLQHATQTDDDGQLAEMS